jgi:hypothetical protein
MSELAKTIGESTVTLDLGERKLKLAPYAIEDYAAFELFLEENAWASVHRANAQKWVNPDQHDKNVQNCIRLIASEKLAYGSEAYSDALVSLKGLEKMLGIALKKTHPEIDEKELSKIVRDHYKEVFQAIMANDAASQ